MNNSIERKYIQLIKKKIEKILALNHGNTSLKSSDLEYVSKVVKEKSGTLLSLSTLKRFWKEDFTQLPQPATLNALAMVLDYKDWQEFKQANRIKTKSPFFNIILSIIGLILIVSGIFLSTRILKSAGSTNHKKINISGPIHFSAEKTVTSGLPNTIIFNYDLSNVKADSFFFQQSWNDNQRIRINPNGKAVTTIYYESGYHRAYLIANDSFIAMTPVHIISDGWEPHVYYSYNELIPFSFKKEDFIKNGQLHVDKSLLEHQHVDLSRYFFTRIVNSREFNVSSDNFSLVSSIKLDSLQYSECPWMTIVVVNEKNIFMISLQKKGCEHYAYYKLGEIERRGSDNDLSALGCNVYQWQKVGIKVINKNATIRINGKDCFHEKYKENFGKIVALIYIFERTGSIDFVNLFNNDGNIVFADNFE